jgi:mannose-6-phosphate isomerase-like protein (cupin superfamily)
MPSLLAEALPRRIENAITGDRIVFLASPLLGDGDALVFRCWLPANAAGAPLHRHADMEETFLVEEGALEMLLPGGETRRLGPGERITIAPGTDHGFRNAHGGETVFVNVSSPGLELEKFLRMLYGLANEGRTDAAGMPRDLRALAVAIAETGMRFAGVPGRLQQIAFSLLSFLGELTGVALDLARFWVPQRPAGSVR